MPEWTRVPLDHEPWPTGTDVFVRAVTPFTAELPKHTAASDRARQQFFEEQVRRIAWHLGSDQVPVYLDFNGERRRMDKGCVGQAVASGFLMPPENGPSGYVEAVVIAASDTRS